jgi:hypothetical protein
MHEITYTYKCTCVYIYTYIYTYTNIYAWQMPGRCPERPDYRFLIFPVECFSSFSLNVSCIKSWMVMGTSHIATPVGICILCIYIYTHIAIWCPPGTHLLSTFILVFTWFGDWFKWLEFGSSFERGYHIFLYILTYIYIYIHGYTDICNHQKTHRR